MESGRSCLVGCADHTLDLAIARSFNLSGGKLIQLRVEMYNALDAVVYNARVTQLQLVSPTNQTIRNSQFLPNGEVDPARLRQGSRWRYSQRGSFRDPTTGPSPGNWLTLDRYVPVSR